MVFYLLREKPKIRILGEKFGASASTGMHELKNLLPKLIVAMRGSISWPHGNLPSWMGAMEKHFHCRLSGFNILAQVIIGLDSQMYQVTLHTGHNNDPGAWNISGVHSYVELATSNSWLTEVPPFLNYARSPMLGYSHYCLITPDLGQSRAWNNEQKAHRSIVETVIGNVKNWAIAKHVFRGAPEMQTMALLVVYQLSARKLARAPLKQIN
jgi:hypothetical protein